MNKFFKTFTDISSLTSSSLSKFALNQIDQINDNTKLKKSVFNNIVQEQSQKNTESKIKKSISNIGSKQVKDNIKSALTNEGYETLNKSISKRESPKDTRARWNKEYEEIKKSRDIEKLKEQREIELAKQQLDEHINKGVETYKYENKGALNKNQNLINSTKKEAQRRQEILQDRINQARESQKSLFSQDSTIGKLLEKRKKRINDKKVKKRSEELSNEKAKLEKIESSNKVNKEVVQDYEFNKMLLDNEVFDTNSKEYEELQNFFNDKNNELNYEQAKLNLEGEDSPDFDRKQNELNQRREEINKEKVRQNEIKYKEDTEFANKYVNTYNEISDLNPGENNYGNFTKEEYEEKLNFIEENQSRFDSIDEKIVDKAIDDFDIKKGEELFANREARLKNKYSSDKEELRNVNRQIKELKKNKSTIDEKDFTSQLSALSEKKNNIKSNLKESREKYKNRKNPNTYKREINELNKEIKTLEDISVLNEAKDKLNAGNISEDDFLAIKTQLFGDSEPKAPGRSRQEIEEEILKNKKILKGIGAEVPDIEEDIVDKFKNKMKTTSKVNLAFSGINAIAQYKDSRKEGRGVVSSIARAGIDFALSEVLGGGTYMALGLLKEVPGLAIKGAETLHREVRDLNTASRFTVFGEAQFQDSEQLATMRQSGMELAKMSQYRLEQTVMGNEARYLHK